jgi:hypothetical protein
MRPNSPADTTLVTYRFTVERFEVESPQKLVRRVRFQPVERRLTYEAAELYATNSSPRDRMRHQHWLDGTRNPTLPYTRIDPRLR